MEWLRDGCNFFILYRNEGVKIVGNIIYKYTKDFNERAIKELYEDAGWIAYTRDLPTLINAIKSSLMVVSAWDDDKLAGLIRVVGDGLTIIYIQDIIVLSSYKRNGIGSRLLKCVFDKYSNVRQNVLITDDTDETRGFYEANGFISCDKGEVVAFVRFD